jgi:hypothetical protein
LSPYPSSPLQQVLRFRLKAWKTALLIAEAVRFAAIRAYPVDVITGHPPHIFLHARLTDNKSASARPNKSEFPLTATATPRVLAFPVFRISRPWFCRGHGFRSHNNGDTESSIRNRSEARGKYWVFSLPLRLRSEILREHVNCPDLLLDRMLGIG